MDRPQGGVIPETRSLLRLMLVAGPGCKTTWVDYDQRTDEHAYAIDVNRLVVLGDPHGDVAGLDAVLVQERRPGTAFVSVGDNVGYAGGPDSSTLCERLAELNALSVYGNHEDWMDEEGRVPIVVGKAEERYLRDAARVWCRALPVRLALRFASDPKLRVVVRHSIGTSWSTYVHRGNADLLAMDERSDVVFVGHAHGARIYPVGPLENAGELRLTLEGPEQREVEMEPGFRYVVDAGSLARPGYHPEPGNFALATYAVLDAGARRLSIRVVNKSPCAP